MGPDIIVYSNNCPKCIAVKRTLDEANINFSTRSDMGEIVKLANEIGASSMPILQIGSEYFHGTAAVRKAKELLGE